MPELLSPEILAAAYASQDALISRRIDAGGRIIGGKIGLGAKGAQVAMGLAEPVSGLLLDGMRLASGATIPRVNYRMPRVEAEVCFTLGRDLDDPDATEADIVAAITALCPAIEVVDAAADWPATAPAAIAENVSAAWYVCGLRAHADPAALAAAAMSMRIDWTEVATGQGAATHGGPLPSLVWLARNLARRGHPLRAGMEVMSGAFAPMLPVAPGLTVAVDIAGLGHVEVAFGT
jgi:2-keto-4-pentenoate hydratase